MVQQEEIQDKPTNVLLYPTATDEVQDPFLSNFLFFINIILNIQCQYIFKIPFYFLMALLLRILDGAY